MLPLFLLYAERGAWSFSIMNLLLWSTFIVGGPIIAKDINKAVSMIIINDDPQNRMLWILCPDSFSSYFFCCPELQKCLNHFRSRTQLQSLFSELVQHAWLNTAGVSHGACIPLRAAAVPHLLGRMWCRARWAAAAARCSSCSKYAVLSTQDKLVCTSGPWSDLGWCLQFSFTLTREGKNG